MVISLHRMTERPKLVANALRFSMTRLDRRNRNCYDRCRRTGVRGDGSTGSIPTTKRKIIIQHSMY